MRARAIVVVAAAVAALIWPGSASADDSPVLVDDDYAIEMAFGDEGATGSITLMNPAASTLSVVAMPKDSAAQCRPVSDPLSIPSHSQREITVKFTGCSPDARTGSQFTLVQTGNESLPLFPTITATPPPEPSPDWGLMVWFLIAGFAGAVVLLITYGVWRKAVLSKKFPDKKTRPALFIGALPALGSSWSFKESWASNATLIAAAFTGIFGVTDLAKTVLGESDGKSVFTITAVAVAVSVGLAGVAPLMLQTCRSWDENGNVNPLGLIAAGTLTLAGTGGVLGVTVFAVLATKAGNHDLVRVVGGLGAVLLLTYAVATTIQNLSAGIKTAEAEPKVADALNALIPWVKYLVERGRYLEKPEADRHLDKVPEMPTTDVLPMRVVVEQRQRTAIM